MSLLKFKLLFLHVELLIFRLFFHLIYSSCPSKTQGKIFSIDCIPNCLGDKFSTNWDKAWSSYRKKGKKNLFSQFTDKYVSWNPRRSDYPLSEEVDPIKRTEKSNLMLWTSRTFTLGGAIVIVTFLLLYTILAPIK